MYRRTMPQIDAANLTEEQALDVCASLILPYIGKNLPEDIKKEEALLKFQAKSLMAITKPNPDAMQGVDPGLLKDKPSNN